MQLVALWEKLSPWPGGKMVFSKILGKKVPYSGTIGAEILHLAPGHAKVQMRDRRCVRNHLRSIHAVALMNLAELTTGIAMVGGLSEKLRAILVGFEIEYLKKARGTITGEARFSIPTTEERTEQQVSVELKNEAGDTVCRAKAKWLVGPADK